MTLKKRSKETLIMEHMDGERVMEKEGKIEATFQEVKMMMNES